HLLRDVPGPDLVAERGDGLRRRADPDQARVDDRLRELGVLGQEAVAGVDGVGAGAGGDVQQLGDVEVGLGRCSTAQRVRLAGHLDVQGVTVLLGVDGHAADPGVRTGTRDPYGDLAPIGYQNLLHRRPSFLASTELASTEG